MESHGDITRIQPDDQGRVRVYRLWRKATNILNSVAGGVQKTPDKWKKVWADWKSKTKKKALTIHRHRNENKSVGPRSKLFLTDFEERLLVIMGAVSAEGQYSVDDQQYNSSSLINIRRQIPDDEGSQSSPIPSPEHITPNTPPSVSREQAQQSTSRDQAQSYSDHEQSQQFYSQEQVYDHTNDPTVTTRSMTNRRGQTLANSVPRLMTRPRRRVVQIPFDRSTSEFLNIEKRRLALEEVRERNNSRRIDVDIERNKILSRFADLATTLLQHYLGKDNTECPIKTE